VLFHFLLGVTEEKKKNLSGYLMTELRLIMIINNTNYISQRANLSGSNLKTSQSYRCPSV
jgi:hypothetical protein